MGPQRSIYKKVFTFLFHFSLTVSVLFSFPFTLDFKVHRPKTFPCFSFDKAQSPPFWNIIVVAWKTMFLVDENQNRIKISHLSILFRHDKVDFKSLSETHFSFSNRPFQSKKTNCCCSLHLDKLYVLQRYHIFHE